MVQQSNEFLQHQQQNNLIQQPVQASPTPQSMQQPNHVTQTPQSAQSTQENNNKENSFDVLCQAAIMQSNMSKTNQAMHNVCYH